MMLKETSKRILEKGFVSMGDHYTKHGGAKNLTITEHKIGTQTMLEILAETKTRKLKAPEKEVLDKIAIIDRVKRLESVDIGEQTSLLLSVTISEEDADNLDGFIDELNNSLDNLISRIE